MACEEFEADLSAWVDGELNDVDHARLTSHLQTCGECSALLRQFQGNSALLRDLPAVQAPPYVTDAAMRLVRQMPRKGDGTGIGWLRRRLFEPFFSRAGVGAMALAAALIIAIFVGRMELRPNTTDSAPPTQTAAAPDPYRLSSVPADSQSTGDPAQAGYDFRDPKNHGRRDVATFDGRERLAWKRGTWHHERRFGRDGAWWDVSGAGYWYEQPQDGPPAYVSDQRFAGPASASTQNR
ncbi:MAG: zf-HC2 domain-containing protein [Xanthobacteraceae bacterium]|jgi:hypothetical protein